MINKHITQAGHSNNWKRFAAQYWFPILGLAVFLLSQWPTLAYCWQNWMEADSYYSHGPIVPMLAGFMIWSVSGKLRKIKFRNSWYGLPLLILGTAVQIAGLSMSWEPLYGLSFILSIFGIIICLLGPQAARILAIPLLFLATMLPLPANLLDSITSRFQIISTTLASGVLRLADSSLIQQGNIINADSLTTPLMVDRPCSGLKLLIALITSTWFMAWILDAPIWKKLTLFGLSFPLSIMINSLRVIMIGLVGIWTSSNDAVKSFHDYSGYIGLALCCALVLISARLLNMYRPQASINGAEDSPSHTASERSLSRGLSGYAAVILLCLAAVSSSVLYKLYDLPNGHLARNTIPRTLPGWTSREEPISGEVRKQLAKGDLLSRTYVDTASGSEVHLFITVSLDYSAFHNPQICLPGSGIEITGQQAIKIKHPLPKTQPINATLLNISRDGLPGFMVYWYSLNGRSFPSASELFAYTRKLRLQNLRQVGLNPLSLGQIKSDIDSRQAVFYRFTMGAVEGDGGVKNLEKFIAGFLYNVNQKKMP